MGGIPELCFRMVALSLLFAIFRRPFSSPAYTPASSPSLYVNILPLSLYAIVLLLLSAAFPSHSAAYAHYPFGSESVKIRRPLPLLFFPYGHYPLDSVPMSCAPFPLTFHPNYRLFHPKYVFPPSLPSFRPPLPSLSPSLLSFSPLWPLSLSLRNRSNFRIPFTFRSYNQTTANPLPFDEYFYIKYCKKSKYEL